VFLFDVMISGSRLRRSQVWDVFVSVDMGNLDKITIIWNQFGHGCYLVVGICVVIWGYSGKVE
jgi:hypothetical protein